MPDWKKYVRDELAGLNLDPEREESIVEELAQHLGEKYDDLVSRGTHPEDARRMVLQHLNRETLNAELRPIFRAGPPPIAPGSGEPAGLLDGIGKDVRVGARMLRQNPGFAVVAILSLGLGIGANAAIFELIDAVVLRTLAVPAPTALVDVRVIHNGRVGSSVSRQHEFSTAIWQQLKQRQQAFSNIAAWSTERFDLGNGGEVHYADGLWVSGSFFDTLRVQPAFGRFVSASDDREACANTGAVLSYSFWQSRFGGRADVLGIPVSLNRHVFRVIGIAPRTFSGLEVGRKFDVALPVCSEPLMHPEDPYSRSSTTWWLDVIGRLKPGWTVQRASAQLASVSRSIFSATLPAAYDPIARKNYLRFSLRASPAATGISTLRNDYEYPLLLLLAISGLVLLIGCANIANLMLARASVRQREMAVRLALGASRSRLVRQLFIENLLLAFTGAGFGALLAQVLDNVLIAGISTESDQVFLSLPTDWRVLAFIAGLAVLTCLVFGVAPAIHACRTEPGSVVKSSGRGLTAGRERMLVQRGFVISQMAFSLMLVVAALLFARTFRNLVSVETGFQQDHVLVADLDASPLKLPMERRLSYERELLDQIRAIPGVTSAAETSIVPLTGSGWNDFIDVPGTNIERKLSNFDRVSARYFRTLRTPMLAGRDFGDADGPNAPPVAIVNRAFAKAFLGGMNCIGKVFGVRQDGGKPDAMYRVIGIVGDTKYGDLREENGPIAFVPDSQDATPGLDFTFVVRSNEDPAALISSVKAVAAKENPEIALEFHEFRSIILSGLGRERLIAALSGFYGLLAAILAIIGIYGVMSYTVVRRTGEIGIRVALGATRGRILGMVLREAIKLVAAAVLIGTVLVVVSGRAVQTMLFGLKPTDASSLGIAVAVMIAVAVAATLLPARRAANLEPMETLRQE